MKAEMILSLFLIVASSGAHSQSAELFWQYAPVENRFWSQVDKAFRDGRHKELIGLGLKQMAAFGKEPPVALAAAEGQLALAIGLARTGAHYGATLLLSDLVKTRKGTAISDRALIEIEDLFKRSPIGEDFFLGEVLFDPDITVSVASLRDFMSYQSAIFNYRLGFNSWSKEGFKSISANSYWRYKYKYFVALLDVQRNRLDSALEIFQELSNDPGVPDPLRMDARHSHARLLFERSDFDGAYRDYSGVDLSPRERGMVLLERAWTKYYLKDYSKALGLLTALEAPIYDTARSPEVYVLKMLIYKDLCYYESVFEVQNEFLARFKKSIDTIRARGDLRRDPMIVNLAVLDRRYSELVLLLNQIKDERKILVGGELKGTSVLKILSRGFQRKTNEIRARLDIALVSKAREVANSLLDWHEQISFIDYQTRVDSFGVTRSTREISFRPEDVSHMSFDKVFWVFNGEFWRDELEDLVVQVESRCPSVVRGAQ